MIYPVKRRPHLLREIDAREIPSIFIYLFRGPHEKNESGTSRSILGHRQFADNCAVTMLDDGCPGQTGLSHFD